MNLPKIKPLRCIYEREEEFSAYLAENLEKLNVGKFENVEREASVDRRRADIVADGVDGILVVENQFCKADWDHWGRLEAYARLREADIAVLVAEDFENLMIHTCNLRNEDSKISWYLIQVQASSHNELAFHHIDKPTVGIQTDVEYCEFCKPIREGKFGELFAGRPVPVAEGRITRSIRNVRIELCPNKNQCYIKLYFEDFEGQDKFERRDEIMELFPKSEGYDYGYRNTLKEVKVEFPVIDKGRDHRDDWDEIRKKLINMGTDIYNKIKESRL